MKYTKILSYVSYKLKICFTLSKLQHGQSIHQDYDRKTFSHYGNYALGRSLELLIALKKTQRRFSKKRKKPVDILRLKVID